MTFSAKVTALTILLLAHGAASTAQNCSISLPASQTFAPLRTAAGLIVYRTGLEVDIDGAPNAYHINGSNDPQTGGLEHICSGADIDTVQDGRLVNKFPDFTVPGSSEQCRQDYLHLREDGFPACGGGMCARFYGVVATNRSCGFPPHTTDTGCGVPIQQTSADGTVLPFYISATALVRRGAARTDQSAYLDARRVAYLVYDSRQLSSLGIHLGDLALAVWRSPGDGSVRAAFTVFGDSGGHLSEASVALLNRLHGRADSDTPKWRDLGIGQGVIVVAFPDSKALLGTDFPAPTGAAAKVLEAGRQALDAAGPDALACAGLADRTPIATE